MFQLTRAPSHHGSMAWRIDQQVIRGEIDNRVRGEMTGLIWFVGRAEPVKLHLTGNAWRDLAGRKLEFVNPTPLPGLDPKFARLQSGQAGDITASRKVKIPDISLDEIKHYHALGKPWTWHWGNSLYLEWFSLPNGRVVIESASFELTITTEPTWEMTKAEEIGQRDANASAMDDFMQRLTGATPPNSQVAEIAHQPLTEAEAEKMQAESDRLVDRIRARLDREGGDADVARIVDEEVERLNRERGEPDLTPAEKLERQEWIDEMNAAAADAPEDDAAEAWKKGSRDPADERSDPNHPLGCRIYELSMEVMRQTNERGWIPGNAQPEHPVVELAMSVSQAGAILLSVLEADWPPELEFCAMMLVSLKKGRGFLDDALLATKCCREESLTQRGWLEAVSQEIAYVREAISDLIDELRERLNPEC